MFEKNDLKHLGKLNYNDVRMFSIGTASSFSEFLRNALELSYSVYVIIYHGFEFVQLSNSFNGIFGNFG